MNCKIYKTEIEELTGAEAPRSEILRHLENCSDCRTFNLERENLRKMLGGLSQVSVPNDFNFRLKSRLKHTENRQTIPWRKTAWMISSASALCFVLILTFVLTRGTIPMNQPGTDSTDVTAPQNYTPTVDSDQVQPLPPLVPKSLQPDNATKFVVSRDSNKSIWRKSVLSKRVLPNKSLTKDDKEINSVDSGLDKVKPSIVPPGFNDPVELPKKQSAGGLLQTVGIETENKAEGLSVISVNSSGQAARADLQADDIILKVNGENPAAISGDGFNEINLIVRRKDKTLEIKIPLKPR